ncbi:ribonuclease P protein component [Mycobacterium simiae]|uniref:ribonuclease P protein component n=1 Tax=Mycobacterium simiae TaxID=1784 RepID=UPI0005C8E96D|nr:ribonuclease P protein component [Mycobacterium simiae]
MLPARNRMRRSREFDATVKYGVRAAQPDLVVHMRRDTEDETGPGPRVGLIVGKSVGSAVDRHRVSRRLRHAARGMLTDLEHNDRMVIRALPGSREASSARLEQELRRGLRRVLEQAGSSR